MASLYASAIPASSHVRNAVPIWTALAPRAKAAAIPRPSIIPPDATTGAFTRIHHLRNQRHGPDHGSLERAPEGPPMGPRFAALHYYRVYAGLFELDGLVNRRGRTHNVHAASFSSKRSLEIAGSSGGGNPRPALKRAMWSKAACGLTGSSGGGSEANRLFPKGRLVRAFN